MWVEVSRESDFVILLLLNLLEIHSVNEVEVHEALLESTVIHKREEHLLSNKVALYAAPKDERSISLRCKFAHLENALFLPVNLNVDNVLLRHTTLRVQVCQECLAYACLLQYCQEFLALRFDVR